MDQFSFDSYRGKLLCIWFPGKVYFLVGILPTMHIYMHNLLATMTGRNYKYHGPYCTCIYTIHFT